MFRGRRLIAITSRLRLSPTLACTALLLALTIGTACNQPVIGPPSGFADTADQPATVVGDQPIPPTVCGNGADYRILIDGFEVHFLNRGPIAPGGVFPGGDLQSFSAQVRIHLFGTETLAGWQRNIVMPLNGRIDSGVRPYGANTQSFPVELFSLQGQITRDPDFDLLKITAGSPHGLPSPGHTTLTRLQGGNWNFDGYFDVMYRVEYIGAPGGALAGKSGNQVFQQHIQIGQPRIAAQRPLPVCCTRC